MKKTILLCVVSALAGAVLSILLIHPPDLFEQSVAQDVPFATGSSAGSAARTPPPDPDYTPGAPAGLDADLTPEERVNIAVYESVNRSVVNIDTRSVRTDGFWMFEVPTKGAGSGVVLDGQGHILTNFHVVEDARAIRVTLFNGKAYEAEPVGADPRNDVAVLKIDAPQDCLFPVELGDSSRLRVGQRALAIGNPFGLERTLSVGVISSVNRPLSKRRGAFQQLIQIDADINPGNSGGPLLDSRGRMIGMNTVIASSTGQSAGVGFAIPVSVIARVIPDVIRHGHVVRADLGAKFHRTDNGLLIAELREGGAAERAGLKGPRLIVRERRWGPAIAVERYYDRSAADLIVGVDGKPARTEDELLDVIESKKPGDRVVVTVIREGRRLDVPVTLDESD